MPHYVLSPCLWIAALATLSLSGRAESGTVRGEVVDRDGKPAAGAKVWIWTYTDNRPLVMREVIADGSGKFSIETGRGLWRLHALRGNEGGEVGRFWPLEVEDDADPEPVTVRLRSTSTLHGRLIDASTRMPISRGTVMLDDIRRVELDREGRFEAPGLALSHQWLYTYCPGYERKWITFDTTGQPEVQLKVALHKAGRVVGRVVNEKGQPIPGAIVAPLFHGYGGMEPFFCVTCGKDGQFAYDGLRLGQPSRLEAKAFGYLGQEHEIIVDGASAAKLDFVLRGDPSHSPPALEAAKALKRRTVSGTVVGPDGKPVAGATVRSRKDDKGFRPTTTKSDAQGRFRFEGMPDAQHSLLVSARGLLRTSTLVGPGGDQDVIIELIPRATIRGRVVDEAGAPVKDLFVVPQDRETLLNEIRVKTDADGRFALTGMPSWVWCSVQHEDSGSGLDARLFEGDETRNVVTWPDRGVIRGRVVDPAGSPVRNFRVVVSGPPRVKPGQPRVGRLFRAYDEAAVEFTRDDGKFTISGSEIPARKPSHRDGGRVRSG
jgi:hypothetical protein